MRWLTPLWCLCIGIAAHAQTDSVTRVGDHYVTLSEIVVNQSLNVDSFIKRVKEDTTFYKAFKNLRLVEYQAINDVRMLNKNRKIAASLYSIVRQHRRDHCRFMEVKEKRVSGDYYDSHGEENYYTAQMYGALFFTRDTICGETNIVAGNGFTTKGLSGIEKHKEQLKMLFFNPGKRISGLPFISEKTAIFDRDMAGKYNMRIDFREYYGKPCYVFSVVAKPGREGDVVIDEMVTWFTEDQFEIVARNYTLKYDAGVYDFDVRMEVEMGKAGDLLVPQLIRYVGDWKVILKKRERGIFTATLTF